MCYTREFMEQEYNRTVATKRDSDICLFLHHHYGRICVFNYEELKQQVRDWNDIDARVEDHNNKTFTTMDGRNWYVLVVQLYKNGEMSEENPMCAMSMLLFGTMVSGLTYAFETEAMRDAVAKAVQTKTPMPIRPFGGMTQQKLRDIAKMSPACAAGFALLDLCSPQKKPTFACSICQKEAEGYGNNPQPVNSGKCCDDCNRSVVIPARMNQIQKRREEEIKEADRKAKQAEAELLAMLDSDSGSDGSNKSNKKSKKEQEKERVRQANKERERVKKQREAFYKKTGTWQGNVVKK